MYFHYDQTRYNMEEIGGVWNNNNLESVKLVFEEPNEIKGWKQCSESAHDPCFRSPRTCSREPLHYQLHCNTHLSISAWSVHKIFMSCLLAKLQRNNDGSNQSSKVNDLQKMAFNTSRVSYMHFGPCNWMYPNHLFNRLQ